MYIKEADPENAVDTSYYDTYKVAIADALEFSGEDREAVAGILAFYLTGMKDQFSEDRLIRTIVERAESIIERCKE